MKTLKLDALPDRGRKLRDEVLFLSENLRQLNIQINNSDHATQSGMTNYDGVFSLCSNMKLLSLLLLLLLLLSEHLYSSLSLKNL